MSSAFDSFVSVHQYQLTAIPEELHQQLFAKLAEDYIDAGEFFELHHGDPMKGYSLHYKTEKTLKKHGNIFLIDHAWTTSPESAKEQLMANPSLMDRFENLMDIEQAETSVDSEEEDDEEEDANAPSEELIKLVASQANVTEKVAEEALKRENNEVVNAIMNLTLDPEAKKEADQLQEQVMGQVLASGTPQEKENKEKEERRKRREERKKNQCKQRADAIYEKMWSFIQTYSLTLPQNGQPTIQTNWYISDEVGSAICHSSSNPNVACAPFIFSGSNGMIPYSIFYPIEDITQGDIITCNLLPKALERESDKLAYLLALEDRVLLDQELTSKRQELASLYKAESEKLANLQFTPPPSLVESADQVLEGFKKEINSKSRNEDSTVVVYTDTTFVEQHLRLPNVKFTNNQAKADIIWMSNDFQDWESLKPHQSVNQFPNEKCMTFKHNLSELIKKTYGNPEWFMTSYNIMTELGEFAGDFLNTEEKEDKGENLWITKPWNMARGLDINITRNYSETIRQYDNPVPKIAQRYLTNPCLYNGKKFDLRYIVLLRRTEPTLLASVYKMFWTRLANKKYDLEDLEDYERQFTVMNYSNYEMTQLDYRSFSYNMEKQHDIKWDDVQKDINAAMKNVLIAAASQAQPIGLSAGTNSKPEFDTFALYGFDIMLTDDFKPVVIEVNFSPDCNRACKYDPEFVNNIFSVIDGRVGSMEKGLEAFTVL